MARRRHHRRRNPSTEDVMAIAIGAVGGGLAVYLYMKGVAANAQTSTVALTSTQPTATGG
jgi:hypothetical protein